MDRSIKMWKEGNVGVVGEETKRNKEQMGKESALKGPLRMC